MANRVKGNLGKIYGYTVLGAIFVFICVVTSVWFGKWWAGLVFAGACALLSSAAYFSQR